MVEPDRAQMTIYYSASALHAGYLRLQTHRICKMYCFLTATVVTRMGRNITFIRTLPVLFSLHILSENQRDIIINTHTYSCKVLVILVRF